MEILKNNDRKNNINRKQPDFRCFLSFTVKTDTVFVLSSHNSSQFLSTN